ncbi:hypothetical protein ANN_11687 [Periplaneta americana]|uniref:Uncharacterized protein n=1 Tax=Periplaneta americana TaxID=6978 RepID=A0ABQ8T787_PERAM|nr:hypothetical protein ANN_11687 [Periplaneta americana]
MAGLCEGGNEPPGTLKASNLPRPGIEPGPPGSRPDALTVTPQVFLKMDLREVGYDRDWINLAQDRDRCDGGNEPPGP